MEAGRCPRSGCHIGAPSAGQIIAPSADFTYLTSSMALALIGILDVAYCPVRELAAQPRPMATATHGFASRPIREPANLRASAFDVLRLRDTDLTGRQYRRRRAALEGLFAEQELSVPWALCPSTTDRTPPANGWTGPSRGLRASSSRTSTGPTGPREVAEAQGPPDHRSHHRRGHRITRRAGDPAAGTVRLHRTAESWHKRTN